MTGFNGRPKHLLALALTAFAVALLLLHPMGIQSLTADEGPDCWASQQDQSNGYCCWCVEPLDPEDPFDPFICQKVFGFGEVTACSGTSRTCGTQSCTPW